MSDGNPIDVHELRVHGVSGTPPRAMLYTDPLPLGDVPPPGAPPEYVRVYRTVTEGDTGVNGSVQAYNWSGLTSGSWLTALWVLMLPFSLANLAGWTAKSRSRVPVAIVRIFGLFLTGVFLNMAVTGSIDVFWHWSEHKDLQRNQWSAFGFLLLGLFWWQLVTHASTRSHFSGFTWRQRERLLWGWTLGSMLPPGGRGPDGASAWNDPSELGVTDEKLWDAHGIVHRLRRIHFGFGFLLLADAALAARSTTWRLAVWILVAISAITLILSGTPSDPPTEDGPNGAPAAQWWTVWLNRVTALLPTLGALVLAFAVAALWNAGTGLSSDHWKQLHDTSSALVGVAMLIMFGMWMFCGSYSAGSATFATLFGLILGAGVTLLFSELSGTVAFASGGMVWLAVGLLIWLLLIGLTLVGILNLNIGENLWTSIHRTTGELTALFFFAPVFAIVVAGFALWSRCENASVTIEACIQKGRLEEFPGWVGSFTLGLASLTLLLLLVFLGRTSRWALAGGIAIAAPLAFLFLRWRPINVAGVQLSLADIESAGVTFAVLLPTGFFLARLKAGLTGTAESRRGTAVMWDVIMFWPRWFHPLAPPSYGPHAVAKLRTEIESRIAKPDDRLILAAHSQGAMIALIALRLAAAEQPERLGLITYGAPICHLYDKYFPSAKFGEIAVETAELLRSLDDDKDPAAVRWANLYRPTDPIGGPIFDSSIDVNVPDPAAPQPTDPPAKDSLIAAIGYAIRKWTYMVLGRPLPEREPDVFRIHSRYEVTPQFIERRDDIRALLQPPSE